MNNLNYKVGLYCRLSLDDGSSNESGSITEDLVKTGSIADVRLGAAIWSGLLGGALSGITTGAQNKQFASLSKFNNRIKVCKSKGLTNSYFTKAVKKN